MAAGFELKRIRLGSNKSANAFAKLLGVDVERYRKWEQKDADPREEDAEKVISFFGISTLEELAGMQKVPNSSKPKMPVNDTVLSNEPAPSAATLLDINLKLTETLQTFANSQQTFANSQLTFADSHKNITSVTERLSRKLEEVSDNDLEQSLADANAKLLIFQEVLNEYAMRGIQQNIADVLPDVNKRFQDYVVNRSNTKNTQILQGNLNKLV